MRKYLSTSLVIFLVILSLVGCVKKEHRILWRCSATDAKHQHWVQHASTRVEAATLVLDRCRLGAYRSTCVARCLPPLKRWHCVATDKGGNTWYWNSTKKAFAVKNAKSACEKNSTIGRCRVLVKNCSET